MKDFINSIWCAQIQPSKEYYQQGAQISELEELTTKNEKKLLNTLNEEQIDILRKYVSCKDELECILTEDAFTEGVRFAVRFLIEALE